MNKTFPTYFQPGKYNKRVWNVTVPDSRAKDKKEEELEESERESRSGQK